MSINSARNTALKILYDINENKAYSSIALNKYLENSDIKDIDRGFITEIVYGTVKWKLTLDWVICQFSSVKFKKISPWIVNILRMGIYQILYMDRVPDSAACNESVRLAKRYGHRASGGYVNGVLRSVARSRDSIKQPNMNKDYIKHLSIKYSHPEWMVKKFIELYGRHFAEELLRSNNEAPDLTVRVNMLKTTRNELIEVLEKEGMQASAGKYSEESVIIRNSSSVARIQGFRKGFFQVQDESSMLVGKIVAPQPGEYIVDVCSAPGGKATHIAELMNNEGRVEARDIHEHKIKLIRDSAERLGLIIVIPKLFNALKTDKDLIEKADRVLVDAPCTGLGIIRRKPDIKWVRKPEDVEEITKLQSGIINAASRYVKPGGILVYSTCTLLPEENEDIVRKFLKSNKNFVTDDISGCLPDLLKDRYKGEGSIRLFPNTDNTDGFFIARLKRER